MAVVTGGTLARKRYKIKTSSYRGCSLRTRSVSGLQDVYPLPAYGVLMNDLTAHALIRE